MRGFGFAVLVGLSFLSFACKKQVCYDCQSTDSRGNVRGTTSVCDEDEGAAFQQAEQNLPTDSGAVIQCHEKQ
jgi:hypothetical protein